MSSELRFVVILLIAGSTVFNFRAIAHSTVEQSFKSNDIVPDVISKAPKHKAVVIYPSGVLVNLGNELTPTQVKDVPIVEYNASPKCFYTLALVDPDAPSRANPVSRELEHWLVVNIPGSNIVLGETLAEYIGSAPPAGSGLHRYVYLVYRQPELLTFDEPRLSNTSTNNRTKFSIALFAEKYSFGDPVAGNFFKAQYDDYVPILNEQLVLAMAVTRFYFRVVQKKSSEVGTDIKKSMVNFRVLAQDISSVSVAFEVNEIVPDVVPKAPENVVEVKYASGVQVNLGNELTPTQVKDNPTVTWNALPDTYYTLALTDPDAPSRVDPTSREFHHWLVGNILGDNILSGETLSAYVGSGPGPGTGFHRYVFLVYKQPGKLKFDEPRLANTSSENRSGFSIANFAVKYGLREPTAGNFYQAQYDDYVPTLYEQLGL